MAVPWKRRGFTLVELLVVITIIGMLVSLLLPAIQSAREAGRRSVCSNNMRQGGLALINYEGNRKSFPGYANSVAGKRASWVVPILPLMERNDLYQIWQNNPRLDLSTISGPALTGTQLTATVQNPWAYTEMNILQCPSNPTVDVTGNPLSFVVNCGSAKTGQDNLPQGSTITNNWPEDANSGVFFNQYAADISNGTSATSYMAEGAGVGPKTSMDFISSNDGTSNTIMMSENLQASNWATDPTMTDPSMTVLHPWKTDYQIKQNAGFVWFLTNELNNQLIASSDTNFNVGSARINTQVLGPGAPLEAAWSPATNLGGLVYSRPSSQHPGGVNMTFCDGHLTFISDEIPYHVYTQLMTSRSKSVVIARNNTTPFAPTLTTSSKATASGDPYPWTYILSETDYQ